MPGFRQKITRSARKQENTQSEETKQPSQPDSDMTQMLELSGREFKITIINMLRTLWKCRPLARQMGKVSRGGNSEDQKEMLESKHWNRKEECPPWAAQ